MKPKQIPLFLKKSREPIYGNFGYRLAALLLDAVIILPVSAIVLYYNSKSLPNIYYTSILNILFIVWYHSYLPFRFGATPGKMIVGLKFLKINGNTVTFKDTLMRYLPYIILNVLSYISVFYCVIQADPEEYIDLSWMEQTEYLNSFGRIPSLFVGFLMFCLFTCDTIVYLSSNRYQSLKDVIAGTVVIFKHMEDDILQEINTDELQEQNNNHKNESTSENSQDLTEKSSLENLNKSTSESEISDDLDKNTNDTTTES